MGRRRNIKAAVMDKGTLKNVVVAAASPLTHLRCEGSGAFRRPGSKGSEGSKGGGGAPLNYRRRPLMKKPLQPPCGRRKCILPLWWLAPPPFPRSSVGRQKESALMGRLGALLRPTWRSYAGPPQWDYGCLDMEPCLRSRIRGSRAPANHQNANQAI